MQQSSTTGGEQQDRLGDKLRPLLIAEGHGQNGNTLLDILQVILKVNQAKMLAVPKVFHEYVGHTDVVVLQTLLF